MKKQTETSGRGRPALPPELRRRRVNICLRPQDWLALRALARRAGTSPGQVVAWFISSPQAETAREAAVKEAAFWGYAGPHIRES